MKRRSSNTSLEVLESRIAPAEIFIGAIPFNADSVKNTNYNTVATGGQFHPFGFTNTSTSGDLISAAVDSPATSNTYFLRLSAGDDVQAYTAGNNYLPFITVTAGNVVAFFTDYNFNGDYDANELTGLALGKNAKVFVAGAVHGDIVTNLDEHGTKSTADDTLDMTGLVSSKQGIGALAITGGSIFGKVLSGGNIGKITTLNVDAVLAGTAANGASFDFYPDDPKDASHTQPGGGGTVSFTATPGSLGASISNALIVAIGDRLEAGAGGAGGKGGNVTNVQITNDTDGFSLLAGAGGAGDGAVGKVNGGAGGDISKVFISGVVDSTPNSAQSIVISAGNGGDGLVTSFGGKGGKASNINIGFELNGGVLVNSGDLLADSLLISGGLGGAGKTGGAGGGIGTVRVRVQTPDVNGDEIAVIAGDGGDSIAPSGGKAGLGGSIDTIDLRNQILTFDSDILVSAGDGGHTVGDSAGAAGGSISNATLLGFDMQVLAGNGSDGKTGGKGGNVSNVVITQSDSILAHNVLLDAGKGGNATGGNAGGGGNIQGIRSLTSDITAFIINSGLEGDGGVSLGGKGGKGGDVSRLDLNDADTANSIAGDFNIRGGRGGDGDKGGGAGGALSAVNISSLNANLELFGGDGGAALANGPGGKGGGVGSVQLTGDGQVAGVEVFGRILTGNGGDGMGKNGKGGAGGNVQLSNVDVNGDGVVIAGHGGSGQLAINGFTGGAAGNGGSVLTTGVFAQDGLGILQAGDAGVDGAFAGNGGDILGNGVGLNGGALSGLRAATTLTIHAGDGSHGGRGGNIKGIAFGSTANSLTPTPSGNIVVQAGDGSGEGKAAGTGGSIANVFGAISSGFKTTTSFVAGNGGSAPQKAANGGSISNVLLSLGGGDGVLLTFQAGDGGSTSSGSKGGNGGSVSGLGVSNFDSLTNLRSIAAGNGGDASHGKGGNGGSINNVAVENHDIGVRTGQPFGFTTMGGLFVGAGGASAPGKSAGTSGSVNQINANAISSIVAGRTLQPTLAKSVSNIFLNEDNLLVSRNGAFAVHGPFTLTFGADTTDFLPGNATKEEVATNLNALSSIQASGGVNVAYGPLVGNTPSYIVTWKQTGDQVPLSGLETDPVDVTEFVKGGFTTPGVTETLPGQVMLNVLELISGQRNLSVLESVAGDQPFIASEITMGDVTTGTSESQGLNLSPLQSFPNSQFTLTFGGLTTGRLAQGSTANQIDANLEALASIAATNLDNDPNGAVVVSQSGPLRFVVTFTNAGPQNLIFGDLLLPESQRLNLATLATVPDGQFHLNFEGLQTPEIIIDGKNATTLASEIQTDLNNLATIKSTANGFGKVKVVAGAPGVFNIMFDSTDPVNNPANGEQPLITANATLPETQQIQFGTLPNDPAATYQLTFGANSTASLSIGSLSATQIQDALNALPSIKATQSGNTGAVIVTDAGNHNFNLRFNSPGDEPSVSGAGFEHEVQTIDLSGLLNVPSADFLLTFNGETTAMRLPAGATAQQIQDALNGLTTIQNTDPDPANPPPPVTVAATGTPGVFKITFAALGEEPLISASGFIHEVQNADIFATGNFQLSFNGNATPMLAPTASAQDVDAALEALPSIQALPGPAGDKVEVVANPSNSPNSSYNIIFHGDGDFSSLGGSQFEPMTVTTTKDGDGTRPEVQVVSYLSKNNFDATVYSIANLVGAIADTNEIDSSTFHYSIPGVFDSPGHLQIFADGNFQLGDIPIDGIVMAQVLNQNTLNFTPEAKLTGPTGAVFFDNDNVI